MRIRAQHFIFLGMAFLVAFVVLAVYVSSRPVVDTTDDADDFLKQLDQAPNVNEGVSAGLIPAEGQGFNVPKIELETTTFSMGTVPNNVISQGKLKVFNRGKAPLIINNVQTSCACTMGFVPQARARIEGKDILRIDEDVSDVIPPGGESHLDIFINPDRIPGFHSTKTLTITSNDPKSTQITCSVSADVDPEFEMEPEELQFGDVLKGQTPSKTVRIRQLQDEAFEVKGVLRLDPSAPEEFQGTVTLLPEDQWKTPGKREWDVSISLLPNLPVGDFMRYAFFDTTLKRPAGYSIPLMAKVVAPYSMVPAPPTELVIRKGIGGSDGISATALINSDTPVTVTDVLGKNGTLKLEVRAGETPNQVLMVATVPDGAPVGRIDDEFSFNVRTERGTFAEKLVVRAYVRDPNALTENPDAPAAVPGIPASSADAAPVEAAPPAAPQQP